jgi:hypothetical protein
VAQFADGMLAMTSARLESLADRAKLTSEQQQREAEMAKNLPQVIGKFLYATGLSILYEPGATIEDITSTRELLKRVSAARIPLLEPLRIVEAKYVAEEDGVLLRLRLPTASEALSFTKPSSLDAASATAPFIEKIAGDLLVAIPKEVTTKEVEAIKQGELMRGMSSTAVSYMFGQPERESALASGGQERLYLKRIAVQFDRQNKVVGWQVLQTK